MGIKTLFFIKLILVSFLLGYEAHGDVNIFF